ncbi:Antilisterial bacteriocin subtilosin biosynthesis protein AlbA [Pseudovibrio axinellae]|uniref:Antilisterial bacteriocin subtilosin biosynthesis protein AlbA n=1 Tax=Pseudovibrio axinellae TaxID=989403 RepID=A0A165WRT7_9HYPH|nr:radical SAM protein [Pseudovibrio axinellae]KZL16825.1 Antilisterial bacteriocin subtilosin biosynthesis protein AlbA [Pseudovibrio axinellae]SER67808.1 radical SAM additional 4Fe4S-binding SPASM domain-containing protein [Pseudovibrio axinellae]
MFKPSYPLHVVFILSNHCNLSCIHCSSNADKEGDKGYTTNRAKEILWQMNDVGVVDVAFSGGEPLLRRDLIELVAYARSLNMTVGTSTNGYPLTEKTADKLKQAGLSRLQVSIDGTQEAHNAIRGPGSFQKALEAVKIALEVGLKTHICFTAMRRNAHLLPDMLELCAQLGVDGFNLSQFIPTGRGALSDGLEPDTAHALLQTWLAAKADYPDMYLSAHSSGLASLAPDADACRGGCQAGISIACVTAEGDVTPCVMFPLSLGNLKDAPFGEIWSNSSHIKALHQRDVKGGCASCSFKWECGGCRAAAWAVDQDMMAEDPYCWLIHDKLSA